MGKQVWVGEHLWNLLNHSVKELQQIYPAYNRNTLKGKKSYWTKQYNEGKIQMPPKPEAEPTPEYHQAAEGFGVDIPPDAHVSWHVGYIKNKEGEIEYTRPLPSVHPTQLGKDRSVDDLFPQVESSVIRPTKRKRVERLGQLILGYGDGQVDFRLIRDPRTMETEVVPLQNLPMHRIILQMNAHYQPETTINGGDFADFAGSSRFPADSDHFNGSMTLAMQWIHDFYSQIVTDNTNAKHVEVTSNHADRPRKKVLKEAPEFYNFYRPGEEYPAWTYYSMAKLGELGIIHPSGYPGGEYIHGEEGYPQILFKHGVLTGNNAVYREADKNPTINIVRWHNHGERMIKRTTREGQQLFYLILGSSCMNGGPVPGYSNSVDDFNRPVNYHNQDHVNSFVMIRDYGQGRYEPVTIDVVDGKAYYDGKEWDGNTPYEWEYKYNYVKEQ